MNHDSDLSQFPVTEITYHIQCLGHDNYGVHYFVNSCGWFLVEAECRANPADYLALLIPVLLIRISGNCLIRLEFGGPLYSNSNSGKKFKFQFFC